MRRDGINILWSAVFWLAILAQTVSRADEADTAAQVRKDLEAGQHAAALALAQQMPEAQQRDALLKEVAIAQAGAGHRAAAVETAALIHDDRALAGALAAMGTGTTSSAANGSRGAPGGSQADFDALIELIQSTVGPPTIWEDMGGQGTVMGFEGGVYVDAQGMLRPAMKNDNFGALAALRQRAIQPGANDDVRQKSPLRKVSLTRLERALQLRAALGQRPTEAMQTLAGLERVKYVLVYPEQRDIVLAGPAGDWQLDREGRLVGTETGRPVMRLDDLVVVLRHMLSSKNAKFGCSITPRQAALAEVQDFLRESGKKPLRPGQREAWVKTLRGKLGPQDVEFNGIDPGTRVARILVEADYRMKLVGMGLEEGVLDVPSYLEMVEIPAGQAPPPMDVLRWWFTVNYDAVVSSADRDAFEFQGQGVKVLSENEMLTATGKRVHTGKSDGLNERFAHNFTKHFAELAAKYPIYAELQNIFDLALVGALVRQEELAEKTQWHVTYFGDPQGYRVPRSVAPKTVETVVNHRVIDGVQIVVGVSGGVRVDPNSLVAPAAIKIDDYGRLQAEHVGAAPQQDQSRDRWWWD